MSRTVRAILPAGPGIIAAILLAGCDGGGDGAGSAELFPVTLAWDAPTTNADGSRLTDLAGYIVRYGTTAGQYTDSSYVGKTPRCTLYLESGIYHVAVIAYDAEGNESRPSSPIVVTVPLP